MGHRTTLNHTGVGDVPKTKDNLQQGEVATPCPQRRADVTVHELDGEALVYDETSGDTHRLNETALFIWRQCDGRRAAYCVAEQLAEIYEISVESALQHVQRMLSEFHERRLVVTPNRSACGG